jgi:hypothetical protein
MTEEEGEEFRQVARLQYAEIERLRAALKQRDAELDGLVGWIAGDQDALSALQAVYADPRMNPANRIKAAASALPFERSKPASVSVVVDFKERVRTARLKQLALDKARLAAEDAAKVIEHQPLDLDAPTPPTVLGGEGPDPAA